VKKFMAAARPPTRLNGRHRLEARGSRSAVFMEKRPARNSRISPLSGSEAATQLVGNHTAPASAILRRIGVWRAEQVRALCVFDKERSPHKTKVTDTMSWNDIPTCKEEGLDVQFLMLRAMFLPESTPERAAF
jgi:tripartite-type tricarboxylate transporter receptor subunit TctC